MYFFLRLKLGMSIGGMIALVRCNKSLLLSHCHCHCSVGPPPKREHTVCLDTLNIDQVQRRAAGFIKNDYMSTSKTIKSIRV